MLILPQFKKYWIIHWRWIHFIIDARYISKVFFKRVMVLNSHSTIFCSSWPLVHSHQSYSQLLNFVIIVIICLFIYLFWLHQVLVAACMAYGILVLQSGIKPTPPALQGGFLTTGPPGKFHVFIILPAHCLTFSLEYKFQDHVCDYHCILWL